MKMCRGSIIPNEHFNVLLITADENAESESTVPPQINLDESTAFAPNAMFFDSFSPLDFALDMADFSLLS